MLRSLPLLVLALVAAPSAAAELPGTKPLTTEGDLAALMVSGMHKYLDRELAASAKKRDIAWKATDLRAKREKLRKILGVVDERVQPRFEEVTPLNGNAKLHEIENCKFVHIRWSVMPGIDAEGIYIRGAGDKSRGVVIAIPDSSETAESFSRGFPLHIAMNGFDVYIPTLIDRGETFSSNAKLGKATNIPHREFVHRMAFEMGRTLIGYEVQKVLAAVDRFAGKGGDRLIGVIGHGDGGRVAMYAAAIDERIRICQVSGTFGPQEGVHEQPLDRNLFGILTEYGDAEVAAMIAPRKLILDPTPCPKWNGPSAPKPGRAQAAPGAIRPIEEIDIDREFARLKLLGATQVTRNDGKDVTNTFLKQAGVEKIVPRPNFIEYGGLISHFNDKPEEIQKRQFDQLVAYTQKLWRDSDRTRGEFWKRADAKSPEVWEKSCEPLRAYFHEEVIGKLPDPTIPLNPRSRQVYDEEKFTGYEVMLDVYEDVFAQGILLLPKDLKPTEKRPVVVCQHGLEGKPRDCIDPEPKRPIYKQFARQLVEKGYIVYCPQNPYYGKTEFRQLQRKANPLKLSLFSFIIRQHQRTLDFLEKLPGVDPDRIGFYGLSYGGKTAMRVPAVEKRYKVSICSGDFNEWIGKMVSVDLDRSYMWTHEYEMYEFNLGNTFNYAEMAALIAPRAFMVERGHDDGVGTDEMVASEYAKVRYLYANRLKIPDRTAIEFSVGGHEIFAKGTFEFLEKHLGKPRSP